ncbi:MAG: hypothetical protein M3Y72_15330 [Acidobacteriota bacterium]|nr:hypothetical protein [Acidobacteriota bacterium]
MIPTYEIGGTIFDMRWDADVSPILGILGNNDVAFLNMEPSDFFWRRCHPHERETLSNAFILVDINVVAQTNWFFTILGVFVHITYSHIDHVS